MSKTLFGKNVVVRLESGATETFTVRQFKTGEWPTLMRFYDDEFSLAALSIGKEKPFVDQLTPASYKLVYEAMKEVNAEGFFDYAARQMAAGSKNVARWIEAGVPVEKVVEMLKTMTTPSSGHSATSPPQQA